MTIDRHKAPKVEREIATYWAELYRQAQASPNKTIRLANGYVVHADDTEFLISLLENFGRYGTFQRRRSEFGDMVTLLAVSAKAQSLIKGGASAAKAWREAKNGAGSAPTFRRIKERVFARLPSVINKKSDKAALIKARRQGNLPELFAAWGINKPKT